MALPASLRLHEQRGGSLPRPAPLDTIHTRDLEPDEQVRGNDWTMRALPTSHAEPWLTSYLYRFDGPEGSILFTGDAGPSDGLTEACLDVDTLVICCAYQGQTHADIARVVTGVPDVAAIAARTRAQTIVLTHQSAGLAPTPGRMERAVGTIAREYNGRLIFGHELTTVSL